MEWSVGEETGRKSLQFGPRIKLPRYHLCSLLITIVLGIIILLYTWTGTLFCNG